MMKLSASLVGFLLSTTALAVTAAQAQQASAPLPTSWTGPYVGVHAGYGWGSETDNLSESYPTLGDKFDISGFLGGIHAGYNLQTNQWVFGVEADIDVSGLKGSFTGIEPFAGDFQKTVLDFRNTWQSSLRFRLGVAIDNILLYTTAGIAFADAELDQSGIRCDGVFIDGECDSSAVPFGATDSNILTGWTVGAGTEVALDSNWSARLEVRYTDFADKTFNLVNPFNNPVEVDASFDETVVTVGLSYRF